MKTNPLLFEVLDKNIWPRYEYFSNYIQNDPNVISITVNLDISNFYYHIKDRKMRFFAALSALISIIVNKHNEFKISYNEKHDLGIYSFLNPSYTVFHDNDKSFSCAHSQFNDDYHILYRTIVQDLDYYKSLKGFEPLKVPENSFPITSIPWITYCSFSIIEYGKRENFFPFIIIGKYERKHKKIILPITFQIHHAVADAYHISCFFNELQDAFNRYDLLV